MPKTATQRLLNILALSLGLPRLAYCAGIALRRAVGENEARNFSRGIWGRHHSEVVRHYRLQTVEDRVRWLCRFLAIQTVIWIGADYTVMNAHAWSHFAVGRLFVALCLSLLSRWRPNRGDVERGGSNLLGALLGLLCLWQIYSCYILAGHDSAATTTVMSAYFNEINILAVGVAIFPLTVLESASLLAILMGVLVINVDLWPARLELMSLFASALRLALVGSIGMIASALQLISFVEATEDSAHDRLTDLLNRKFGEELLSDHLRSAARRRKKYTLLFLDLDCFKTVNDTFGHEAGDKILLAFAQSLRRILRSQDMGIRWGGEEFLVLLSDTDAQGAAAVIERLASGGIGNKPDGTPMTASIGVVETNGNAGGHFEALVARADKLMYAAKTAGRNRYAVGEAIRPFIRIAT